MSVLVKIESQKQIKKPKEDLKQELKELFNGAGVLSDFVFYDVGDIKGLQKERTEVRRPEKAKSKGRDLEEKVIAQALKDYGRGVHKDIISTWALALNALIYGGTLKPQMKGKISSLIGQINRAKSGPPARRGDSFTFKRGLMEIENELQLVKDEFENLDKNRKRRELDMKLFENLQRSPVQAIDHERMRRAASFEYYARHTCKMEGDVGATSNTVMLCQTCYNTIDFGNSV